MTRIFARYREAPRLQLSDLLLVIVPALAWTAAVHARPAFMTLRCAQSPTHCLKSEVNPIDALSIGLESSRFNAWSFHTQYAAGVVAVVFPLLWLFLRNRRRRQSLAELAREAGTDFALLLETTLWNGVMNESMRLLVQRPRPFVYLDPMRFGQDPANYTSFYSGHTSFTSTAMTALFFTLMGRHATPLVLRGAFVVGAGLVVSTAAFRILSGRHYFTDTLAGAVAGFLIAVGIAWLHRSRPLSVSGT